MQLFAIVGLTVCDMRKILIVANSKNDRSILDLDVLFSLEFWQDYQADITMHTENLSDWGDVVTTG